MPKLLIIFNRMVIGGASHVVATLIRHLHTEFEIMLILGHPDPFERVADNLLESLPVKPVYISNMQRDINPANDLKAYREIREIIRQFRPDIVHSHGSKPGALARWAAFRERVPAIVHTYHGHVFHSYFGKSKTKLYLELERRLAKKSNALVALSQHQKTELGHLLGKAIAPKIHVIPIGLALQQFHDLPPAYRQHFRHEFGLAEDVIALGIVGRLVPVKNHKMFIESFALARKESRKKLVAVIVGDGELREMLQEYCRKLGLTINDQNKNVPDVIFTSWRQNVEEVYAGLDIVCLTSLNEGTPVSVLEAQAAGKAVLSTDCGGINDVVEPGETALLADTGNIKKFADHMVKLGEDDSLRLEMGKRGRIFSQRFSSPETMAQEYEKLYREIISAGCRKLIIKK